MARPKRIDRSSIALTAIRVQPSILAIVKPAKGKAWIYIATDMLSTTKQIVEHTEIMGH